MRHCEYWSTGRVLSNRDKLGRFMEGDRHRSEENKQKIRESLIGVPFTEERINNIKKGLEGKHPMLGKHWSKKTKEKMSKSHKALNIDVNGERNPFYGKEHTEESRRKMSVSLKGKTPWNKGIKTNVIPWNKGKKGLQVAWNKGIERSEECKRKLSKSLKEYWNRRREQ